MSDQNHDELEEFFSELDYRVAEIRGFGNLAEQSDGVRDVFTERVGALKPEEVFTFNVTPSTQALDSYGTRMAKDSMTNYLDDVVAGVPFMNSHRTGGFFSGGAQLPLGYSFDGELSGKAIDERPLLKRWKEGDEEPDPMKLGMVIKSMDYLLRGHFPNGSQEVGTDDLIRSIEGRVLRGVSIGFGHKPPSRIEYVCSLDGLPMGRGWWDDDEEGCRHVPLIRDKLTGLLAFAWVKGAKMYEHSGVFAGATPGAVVNQARAVARLGELDGMQLDFLEDKWRVSIRPGSSFGLAEGQGRKGERGIDEMDGDAKKPDEEVLVDAREDMSRIQVAVDNLAAQFQQVSNDLSGRIDGLAVSLDEIRTAVSETSTMLNETVRVVADLQVKSDADMAAAKLAEEEAAQLRQALVDEAVAARVRALGPDVNEERYRSQLAAMGVEEIQAEIDEYERAATSIFNKGRPSSGAERKSKAAFEVDRPDLYQA